MAVTNAVYLQQVRQLIRAKLLTVPGITTAIIAAENRAFTPPNPPGLWIEEAFGVSSEQQVAWGQYEVRGIAQYNVMVPVNSGTEISDDLTTQIEGTFSPPNWTVNGGGLDVNIDQASRLVARQRDALWFMHPVRIFWRTYANVG